MTTIQTARGATVQYLNLKFIKIWLKIVKNNFKLFEIHLKKIIYPLIIREIR